MNLHNNTEDFNALISIVAADKHIPADAVERDYYIVILLNNLAQSPYAEDCVFKGGTSLSKCYPGSIERFSEDIDITYCGEETTNKKYSKKIKQIEKAMTVGANVEPIGDERSDRSKSANVWFNDANKKIKLEIGSVIRPDPYQKRIVKSYIHEYLESKGFYDDIEKYELVSVEINVLNIERTFIDKIMSVRRHAMCGTLPQKVRHIYDVTRLYHMREIQDFLSDKQELKRLIQNTKKTDVSYLSKRQIDVKYDTEGSYDFNSWRSSFETSDIKKTYERLHTNLLYTDEKQPFDEAVKTFCEIDELMQSIDE